MGRLVRAAVDLPVVAVSQAIGPRLIALFARLLGVLLTHAPGVVLDMLFGTPEDFEYVSTTSPKRPPLTIS